MTWDLARAIYFYGIPCVFVGLLILFTVEMYRDYYSSLKTYIEADGKNSKRPSNELGGGDIGGAILIATIGGVLWPLVIVVGVIALIVYGGKTLLEAPFHAMEKKLVQRNSGRMITSPSPEIRELRAKYAVDKKEDL